MCVTFQMKWPLGLGLFHSAQHRKSARKVGVCKNQHIQVKQHSKRGPSLRPRIRGPKSDHFYVLLKMEQWPDQILVTILKHLNQHRAVESGTSGSDDG